MFALTLRAPFAPSKPSGFDIGPASRALVASVGARCAEALAAQLQDATRATADAPTVVDRVPENTRPTPVSTNPVHRKLPRP